MYKNGIAMQSAHVIYGPVAAGKSTFAIRLATERNAVRFAVDDWMHTLFAPDLRSDIDMAWALDRVARCQAMIGRLAHQILATGRDVVLELGLMREEDRARARASIEAAGHQVAFYFVDADVATRRQRVAHRNVERGATYSFEVTPGMFEAIERQFERPTAREHGHTVVMEAQRNG